MIPSKIKIDQKKCSACGNCIKICGSKTLEFKDNTVIQKSPALCCSCGHCAAICTENAISASEEYNLAFTISNFDENLTEIDKLFIGKRSVREFKNLEIEKNILENFIHYAEKSPSSSNARKREYVVITEKNKIQELEKTVLQKFNALKIIVNPFIISIVKLFNKKLSLELSHTKEDIKKLNKEIEKGYFPIFRNAPCVICIIAPKGAVQSKDDCIIAQQYMMLYAQSKGIGSCIIGYAQYAHKSIEKVLKIKKGYSVLAISIFGYPTFTYNKEIQYLKKTEISWI